MANGKARASGSVYRDEAAELMAAAARSTARPPPPELDIVPRRVVPEANSVSSQPLPYPEPVGTNDNSGAADQPAPHPRRRRIGPLHLAARVLIAPWYAVVAAGALGIIVLFAGGFFFAL